MNTKSNLILPGDEMFVPGTVKPEADYKEIERLGKKLGIPVPMMHIKVEAQNPDGSPGARFESRSRTFNRNFWNGLFTCVANAAQGAATFGAGYLAGKGVTGAVLAQDASGTPMGLFGWTTNGAANNDTYGIVIGTGSTAESFGGTNPDVKILQGVASGKMVYGATNPVIPTYSSGTKVWTQAVPRIFNNNSGATIIVAETAILGYMGLGYVLMFCRDVLGSPVSVLNGGQLTVTYTMTMTFPN